MRQVSLTPTTPFQKKSPPRGAIGEKFSVFGCITQTLRTVRQGVPQKTLTLRGTASLS
jgi:hypothetical protein